MPTTTGFFRSIWERELNFPEGRICTEKCRDSVEVCMDAPDSVEMCTDAPGCHNHVAMLFRVPASVVEPNVEQSAVRIDTCVHAAANP